MVVKYVCVATEKKLYLPFLQELLPELVILGMDTPWQGFITKYILLQAYLSTSVLADDDLVCFIDAYDVLPTNHLSQFECNVRTFLKAQPSVKMIVGYDKVDNLIHEYLCQTIFGTIGAIRLNSGQFIGTKKHIREIVSHILSTTGTRFQTDQIELTKYANAFKSAVYIDEEQTFFYVKSRPLQQVRLPATSTSAFIHANGNGFLEDFLRDEHAIHVGFKKRINHLATNVVGVLKKIVIYDTIYIKKYLAWFITIIERSMSLNFKMIRL
jgi:hypothetical protein